MLHQFFQTLAIALGFMLLPGYVRGQELAPDTSFYAIIHTTDGHEFVGKVLSMDAA